MIDFWLKYPLQTFRDGSLMLASGWPLAVAVMVVAAAALLIGIGLYRAGHNLSPLQRWSIGSLQVLMLALLVLLLWQPSLAIDQVMPGTNTLAVLVDDSASMAYADNGKRRIDLARELLNSEDFGRLSQQFEVQLFRFSDQAQPLQDLSTLSASSNVSAVTGALAQVLRGSANNPLGAVLVLSDGLDTSPLAHSLADLAGWQVPVHTLGLGRQQIPEDLGISDVQLPSRLTPGSALRAQVTLVHDGAGTARLKVSQSGQLVGIEEVVLGSGTRTSAWLELPLPETGHHELTFSLEPSETDRNLANNSLTRMLEVAPRVRRILYIEGEPRWEYKFLRRALSGDPGLKLETLLRVSPNKYYRQGIDDPSQLEAGFPTDRETLFSYHGIIIGSIEAASFSDQQLELIRDFVAHRGGGLLMLAGRSGLGQGGWGNSALAGVLPTMLPPPERESFARQRWPVLRSPEGARSNMLQLASADEEDAELWQSLPALANYQQLGDLKPAAVTLLSVDVNGSPEPLMVQQPYGRGLSIALATSGTWRWQMSLPLEDYRHETFWRQLLRTLGSEAPEAFELSVTTEGSQLHLRAELRDESFEPLAGQPVTAMVSGTTSSAVSLSPVPGQLGVYQAQLPLGGDGPHFVEASSGAPVSGTQPSVQAQPGAGSGSARAALFHAGQRAERVSLAQNRAGLAAISSATGGQYFTADQLSQLPQVITASSAGITRTQILPLWDAPLALLLLVLLKSTEWLLRRRWAVI